MYDDSLILGTSLPAKTLCLTFDDGPGETSGSGPGPHTLQIAQYLAQEGIQATFFMVGKHGEQYPSIPPQVRDLGHLVGNHTFNHPDVVDLLAAGGDVIDQIARTDAVISDWITGPATFVRPPYGDWSADVALKLNNNLAVNMRHVGPIGWDMDGGDLSHWLNGDSAQVGSDAYLAAIQAADRGIVLMHDSTADIEFAKSVNLTYAMVQILVPALKSQGYQFVPLTAIPDVLTASQRQLALALQASNGKYISPQAGGGGTILVDGPAVGAWETLGIDYVAPGKVAIRAPNGMYLSPQNGGGGEVLANGPGIGGWESLDLIPVGPQNVAFRTATGHYLTREIAAGGQLRADVTTLSGWETFTFKPV